MNTPGRIVGRAWDRMSLYVPVMLMGLLALGTYWLARNTPVSYLNFRSPTGQRTCYTGMPISL